MYDRATPAQEGARSPQGGFFFPIPFPHQGLRGQNLEALLEGGAIHQGSNLDKHECFSRLTLESMYAASHLKTARVPGLASRPHLPKIPSSGDSGRLRLEAKMWSPIQHFANQAFIL